MSLKQYKANCFLRMLKIDRTSTLRAMKTWANLIEVTSIPTNVTNFGDYLTMRYLNGGMA
jgi:hypothetical protein